MNQTTVKLQVPLDKTLRDQVERHARKQGFSSVQDFTRVLFSSVVRDKLEVNFQPRHKLSPEAEARYDKQLKEFYRDKKVGKVKSFDNVEDFLAELKS